jgi:2'-5' RNA ligase
MTAIRAFIAIELPAEVRARLGELSEKLQRSLPPVIRWVPANNIHLTLKFLGDTSPTNLEFLAKIMAAEAARRSCFEFTIGGLGTFPSIRRPRVIWVGVQAPRELDHLQRAIEAEAPRLGYSPDGRPFSPHLTLGRVNQNASPEDVRKISDLILKYPHKNLGSVCVEQVVLFRSDLSQKGATYVPLATAKMGKRLVEK